ncbi:MAG: T9SS type A sorting domain-containing protein [Bacteroidia bacterium]
MKKHLLPALLFCSVLAVGQNARMASTQPSRITAIEKNVFDEKAALEEAKAHGVQPADYAGYIRFKKQQAESHDALPTFKNKAVAKTSLPQHTSSATNADFETGDFTGWTLYTGDNTVNSFGPLQNIMPAVAGPNDSIGGVNTLCNPGPRHNIMTSAYGNDPFAGFPTSSPMGGNYTAKLNRYCANYEASVLEQNFLVTAGQTFLNYVYSVVLQDGGHAQGEQPYFAVVILDALGDTIPGTYVYMQAANGTTPGFYPVASQQGTAFVDTYYKPWTPVSNDLSAYLGQNVTIRFTAADCIFGGHSGYAYVDAMMSGSSNVPNVWPGDANYDLVADVNDLLYIGWAYGASGTTRAGATNTWQAEPSADWGMTTAYGTEFKHADCNGDGTIDLNDTLAISNNYNMSHTFKLMNPANTVNYLSNYRNLALSSTTSSVSPNQTFTISADLPASNFPAADKIYGIAFKLHVPSQYVTAMNGNDYSSSFLGTNGTNMITMARPFTAGGYIDYCMTRRDYQNSTGSGNLFSVDLTASNFAGSGSADFSISDVVAVAYNGEYLPIGSTTLSMNFTAPTGIASHSAAELSLRPNPASDRLFVEGVKGNNVKFEVLSIIGEIVLQSQLTKNTAIDVSGLEKGAYFIRIHSAEGTQIKKFIKE